MNRILAIANITVRNAIRSRIVIVLLAALFIALIGLPLTLRGDGTLSGHVQIMLRYTPGLAMIILSIATVWAACATIAIEIQDRQIQMILSKPVHPVQIWLGKWLGLTALNAVLLLMCAVATYGSLMWTTQPDRLDEAEQEQLDREILVAQRKLLPRQADLSREVRAEIEAGRARGEWPPEVSDAAIRESIERFVRARANAVSPGGTRRWVIDVPHPPPPDRPMTLRYRFSTSMHDRQDVAGAWRIGAPNDPERLTVPVYDAPMAWQSIAIPPELIGPDRTVTVEYANVHERPLTLVFDPLEGFQLLVYEGGFTPNFIRAFLLLLVHLSFLAAIGITASAFFSVPVAALSSFYFLILLNTGRFVERIAERGITMATGPDVQWYHHVFDVLMFNVYRVLHVIIQPVYAMNPLDYVASGELITWSMVLYMVAVKTALYTGILAVIGGWHLSRREVALPM